LQHGGISKASKGINLSEDIFAGYNNILRGGGVEFKEYLQVTGPTLRKEREKA
jgi:callose synthase